MRWRLREGLLPVVVEIRPLPPVVVEWRPASVPPLPPVVVIPSTVLFNLLDKTARRKLFQICPARSVAFPAEPFKWRITTVSLHNPDQSPRIQGSRANNRGFNPDMVMQSLLNSFHTFPSGESLYAWSSLCKITSGPHICVCVCVCACVRVCVC